MCAHISARAVERESVRGEIREIAARGEEEEDACRAFICTCVYLAMPWGHRGTSIPTRGGSYVISCSPARLDRFDLEIPSNHIRSHYAREGISNLQFYRDRLTLGEVICLVYTTCFIQGICRFGWVVVYSRVTRVYRHPHDNAKQLLS